VRRAYLVLVIAEPGEPRENASPQPGGEPDVMAERIAASVGDAFRAQKVMTGLLG
jgi:hypothetical protein